MDEYPEFFRAAIQRALHQSLTQVQAEPGPLPATVRDQALHILTFALKLDEAWPLTRTLLLDLAPKMEQMGHREDWLPYLQEGIAKSEEQHDDRITAELSLQIGEIYRLRSQLDPAHYWFNRGLDHYTKIRDKSGFARTLNHLAFAACEERRFAEAQEYALTALALLDETTPERAASFNTLGLVARERREWEQAANYHQRALQIRHSQGDQRRVGWILQNLGNVMRDEGRYAEALDCYAQATAQLLALQDLANCAIAQMNHAITYDLAGQPLQAEPLLVVAEATFRRLNDERHLAKTLTNLGLVYLALEAWQSAATAFDESSLLFQNLADVSAHLNALDGLGMAYIGEGQWTQAVEVLQKALAELALLTEPQRYDILATELQGHLTQAQQGLLNAAVIQNVG